MFKQRSNKSPARVSAESAADKVVKRASDAGEIVAKRASDASDIVAKRASETSDNVSRRTRRASRQLANQTHIGHTGADALLKAQLLKTSRELSSESSDLREAVNSLNGVIKSSRKSAAAGRTRLIGGLAVGAALTYHLDSEHGSERRAATARRITSLVGSD